MDRMAAENRCAKLLGGGEDFDITERVKLSVEHLGLATRDPVAMRDWLSRVLGGSVRATLNESPPAFMMEMPGGFWIELYQADTAPAEPVANSVAGWRHLALRVDSIEELRDRLKAAGVEFSDPVKPAGGGGRVLFFRDPEGNLWHFVERSEDSPLFSRS